MTPSGSATMSSTSSLGGVAGAESLSSGSTGSSGSRISSALRIFVPATLAVALAVLITYLGYRRRRNEAEAKASSDPRAMYATQLGIPLESLKLMSSLEAGSGTLGHMSSVQTQEASLNSGSLFDSRKRTQTEYASTSRRVSSERNGSRRGDEACSHQPFGIWCPKKSS
eukprot:gb/GECG01013082.1/.p1 GENE.gb/GECG01013082.1/~~gb/GECG01013082.1/.p1  ORF type:complete len:169 (+),score=19.11 gb/GECG01013082.1/:1-507(+)